MDYPPKYDEVQGASAPTIDIKPTGYPHQAQQQYPQPQYPPQQYPQQQYPPQQYPQQQYPPQQYPQQQYPPQQYPQTQGPAGYAPSLGTGLPCQQTILVNADTSCQHMITSEFTGLGICLGIFFFPIGLLCCFFMTEKRCVKCGALF